MARPTWDKRPRKLKSDKPLEPAQAKVTVAGAEMAAKTKKPSPKFNKPKATDMPPMLAALNSPKRKGK